MSITDEIDIEATWQTRDGRPVKNLFRDRDVNYPLIGFIRGSGWRCWTPGGHYFSHRVTSDLDLIPTQEEPS